MNVLTCYKPFEEFKILLFFYCFTFTSEPFRVSNLINHVTLCIEVKKKYSESIWRFEAREGKKVKYVFANTTAQRENRLNRHANTLAAVKMNEINPKYENTRKIHRLLTNQNPGSLYKV
jgi:hypothetical protein